MHSYAFNIEMEQTDSECKCDTFRQCGKRFFSSLILKIFKGNPEGEKKDQKIKMRKLCQCGEIIPLLSDADSRVSGISEN